MTKRSLITLIERIRADLNDAISAIETNDVDTAIEKLAGIDTRITLWAETEASK